jgi:hypothetical protein
MSSELEQGKPRIYVSALFCETVLNHEGILSAIKILDTFYVEPFTLTIHKPDGTPESQHAIAYPPLKLRAIVTCFSESPAQFTFRIRAINPGGQEMQGSETRSCETRGGVEGYGMNIDMTINSEYEGVSWFEFYVDDVLTTKLPIKIVRRMPTAPIEQSGSQPDAQDVEQG